MMFFNMILILRLCDCYFYNFFPLCWILKGKDVTMSKWLLRSVRANICRSAMCQVTL